MSKYHKFKDSNGAEFQAMVTRESGRGVDTIYLLEDAHYVTVTEPYPSVPEEELDLVYENDCDRIQTIGAEEAMGS